VEHVEVLGGMVCVFDGDYFGFGEFGAGAGAVDVTANGGYGGDGFEFAQDGDFADVAEMEDARDPGQGGEDFWAE